LGLNPNLISAENIFFKLKGRRQSVSNPLIFTFNTLSDRLAKYGPAFFTAIVNSFYQAANGEYEIDLDLLTAISEIQFMAIDTSRDDYSARSVRIVPTLV